MFYNQYIMILLLCLLPVTLYSAPSFFHTFYFNQILGCKIYINWDKLVLLPVNNSGKQPAISSNMPVLQYLKYLG